MSNLIRYGVPRGAEVTGGRGSFISSPAAVDTVSGDFDTTATVTGTGAVTATASVGTGGGGGFVVTARHSGNLGTSSAQTLTTSSTTPTADSLLLAFYAAENDGHNVATTLGAPTGGGLSYSLVNKIGDSVTIPWDTAATDFRISSALYQATVGSSPTAHTVVFDAYSGTNLGFYAGACVDITGHNTSSPVVQSKTAGTTKPGGSAETGTVVLDSTPTAGNLLIVAFSAGADSGGGFASPTAGVGKTFTQSFNQSSAYAQVGIWWRICDGTESATITCSDLGQLVGNYTAHAVEIAPAGGGGSLTTTATVTGTGLSRLRRSSRRSRPQQSPAPALSARPPSLAGRAPQPSQEPARSVPRPSWASRPPQQSPAQVLSARRARSAVATSPPRQRSREQVPLPEPPRSPRPPQPPSPEPVQ